MTAPLSQRTLDSTVLSCGTHCQASAHYTAAMALSIMAQCHESSAQLGAVPTYVRSPAAAALAHQHTSVFLHSSDSFSSQCPYHGAKSPHEIGTHHNGRSSSLPCRPSPCLKHCSRPENQEAQLHGVMRRSTMTHLKALMSMHNTSTKLLGHSTHMITPSGANLLHKALSRMMVR